MDPIKSLERFSDHAYALLRIAAGFMFAFHGAQKIVGVWSDFRPAFATLPWFAGIIELVCGLAVMIGFQTRWAAFLASGEMAVAYFHVHSRLEFGKSFFPNVNGGEMAVLYCFIFLLIATRGSGRWALDARRR